MKVVTTNLLNRFWKNGVKPIKEALAGKVDSSKIVNSLLATEAGFALDARQGKVLDDKLAELNGNKTFSTDNEVDTGKKWIDGKSIYRKTFIGTMTGQDTSFPLTWDSIICGYGFSPKAGDNFAMVNGYYSGGNYISFYGRSDKQAVVIHQNGYKGQSITFTIEFTK